MTILKTAARETKDADAENNLRDYGTEHKFGSG